MYELLNQLKDAGFPMSCLGKVTTVSDKPSILIWRETIVFKEESYLIPNTDELVKCLGDNIEGLVKVGESWIASKRWNNNEGIFEEKAVGSTPREALIKLYCELHKVKTTVNPQIMKDAYDKYRTT